MRLLIPATQAEFLRVMRKAGRANKATLSEMSGRSISSVKLVLANLRQSGLIKDVPRPYGNAVPLHEISDQLKSLSDIEFEKAVNDAIETSGFLYKTKEARKVTPRVQALIDAPETRAFILANQPYLARSNIAYALGVSTGNLELIEDALGISSFDEKSMEPRARSIRKRLGFLTLDTKVVQWLGGTSFQIPSSTPGINSITRHFQADDDDDAQGDFSDDECDDITAAGSDDPPSGQRESGSSCDMHAASY